MSACARSRECERTLTVGMCHSPAGTTEEMWSPTGSASAGHELDMS